MLKNLKIALPLCSLFLIACSNEPEVRVIKAAKTKARTMPAMTGKAPAQSSAKGQGQAQKPLKWATPKGWKEKKAGGFRLASFDVPPKGDASIVVFGGTAGGLQANVNRWREQAGLGQQSEAEIKKNAIIVKGALGNFSWHKLESLTPSQDSIYAAIIPIAGATVFVKLTGPKDVLAKNKNKFVALTKSVDLNK